jgi:hypothetical protein
MKTTNITQTTPVLLLALLFFVRAAPAQTASDINLVVAGFTLGPDGGEKLAGISRSTGPVSVGKEFSGVWSMRDCAGFSLDVAPEARFADKATVGWRVSVTPIRIVDKAVTFRLRWVRALDTGKSYSSPKSEDVEVTLRPGESRPIDSVPVPAGALTFNGRPCTTETASLRVSAEYNDFDNRLIGADIWLVERLPNGTERSQLQSLRGLPHRSLPFYFDRISDMNLDIFGHIVADPEQNGVDIVLETIRAQVDVPPPADTHGYQAARWFRSTLHVKPDEVLEVPLPPLEERFGPYAKRTFALRIRARQIR